MRDLWEAGKPFLAGFRRHFAYLIPATFLVPFELYERVVRPNFGTDTWPEHLIVPASVFPWVLLGTALWTAFLTYSDLYKEQPKQRIPVNINLDNLRDFYKDRTTTEGDRLIAPYINKWVAVEGKIHNVEPTNDGYLVILLSETSRRLMHEDPVALHAVVSVRQLC